MNSRPPRSSTARSIKALGAFSSKIFSYILALVASILISRALGPAGRGSYYVVVTIASTALSLGHLSVEQAQVFLWSKTNERRFLSANAVALGLLLGAGVSSIAWIVVTVLGPNIVPVADRGLLIVALVGVPAGMVSLYANGLLVLADRISRVNYGVLLAAIVQTGLIVGLHAAGRLTVAAVVVVWMITMLAPLSFTLPSLAPRVRDVSVSAARKAVAIGARYHLGMISVFLLFRSDVFILNALVSRTEVGLYSLAVTLAELLFLLTDSIAQVLLPRQVSGSMEESAKVTAKAVRTNFIVAVVSVAGIVATCPIVIPLLFGKDFTGSIRGLIALSVGVIALGTIRPASGYLIRLNRPLLIAMVSIGALAVNVALNLALIPTLGIVGAGMASSIAYTLLATFQVAWFLTASGISARDLVPRISDIREPLSALLMYRPGQIP